MNWIEEVNRRITSQDSWKQYTRVLGERLGYPKCCIDSFCNDRRGTEMNQKAADIMYKSEGPTFVPCLEHEQQLLNGVSLAEIIGRDKNINGKELQEMCNEVRKLTRFKRFYED